MDNSNMIIYTTEDGLTKVDVTFEDNTVWLSIDQMAELFQRDRSVIGKHVRNIFKEGELVKESVWAKFAYTASDTSFKDFFLQRLDAVSCYDEDLAKSFIALTCKVHDIPLSALSQEQKEALRSIMLKSRKYQATVKQRKNSKKKK